MKTQNFPGEFYQEDPSIKMVKSSDPSQGVLLDPLDLMTPTPWASIEPQIEVSEEQKKKKNLIFLDLFYSSRDRNSQHAIFHRPKAARASGFTIYLWLNGQLRLWATDDLPEVNESLKNIPLSELQELTRAAAWDQLQSSANQTQIVDYSLANALMHQEGVLNADSFENKQKFSEYVQYLSENLGLQKSARKLIINAKDFDETLQILEQSNIDSIEEVEILNTDIFEIKEKIFLNRAFRFKNLKKLTVRGGGGGKKEFLIRFQE